MAVEAGLPQAEFAEYLDEGHGLAARSGRHEVSDLAGQAAVPAPDLAVADDGAAQSRAEEQVREVVRRRGAVVVTFGLRRPVHVVVHGDRPVDVRRQDLGGIELAEQERRVGQVDRPARGAVHRVGGADHRQPGRQPGVAAGLPGGGPQRRGHPRGPGWPAGRLLHSGDRLAVGVDALGDDPFRGDADRQGDAGAGGQSVVRADPAAAAAARGPLAGIRHQPGTDQAAHALAHGRFRDAGIGGELGPGQPRPPHEGAQDMFVGQGTQQLQ